MQSNESSNICRYKQPHSKENNASLYKHREWERNVYREWERNVKFERAKQLIIASFSDFPTYFWSLLRAFSCIAVLEHSIQLAS